MRAIIDNGADAAPEPSAAPASLVSGPRPWIIVGGRQPAARRVKEALAG